MSSDRRLFAFWNNPITCSRSLNYNAICINLPRTTDDFNCPHYININTMKSNFCPNSSKQPEKKNKLFRSVWTSFCSLRSARAAVGSQHTPLTYTRRNDLQHSPFVSNTGTNAFFPPEISVTKRRKNAFVPVLLTNVEICWRSLLRVYAKGVYWDPTAARADLKL